MGTKRPSAGADTNTSRSAEAEVCNDNLVLRNLLREACDMLGMIGCSPEGIGKDIARAEALQARIEAVIGT